MDLESLNRQIIACRKCPRLVAWREMVARDKRRAYKDWDYWGKPVPGFGDTNARVMVVGLAPGAHGSNRTGRQFTGDGSGRFLYPALHRAGYASQPSSISRDDGLTLRGLFITASARCAPPGNKPTLDELSNCQPYLQREMELIKPRVIVCLGRVAFETILRILALRSSAFKFGHGAAYRLSPDIFQFEPSRTGQRLPSANTASPKADYPPSNAAHWLLCSYHPSQQNTLTGKLSTAMFDRIWKIARELSERV